MYVLGFVNSVLACSDFRLLILIKYCCGYFEVSERKRGKDTTSWRRRRGELGGAVAARGRRFDGDAGNLLFLVSSLCLFRFHDEQN